MSRTRTCGALLAVVAAGAGLQTGTAQAGKPDIVERVVERSGVLTSCAGFDVTFTSTITSRSLFALDDQGMPVREIRHVSFIGTLTSPAGTLPYDGTFTRTADLVEQWARFTGVHLRVTRPDGPPLMAAGTDAFSLDPSVDDSKVTGRLPEAFYADVCAAMS